MKLPWNTRVRVAIVKTIARWLAIPVEIRFSEMHAYTIAEIDDYIADCVKLFGPVFDPACLHDFLAWVHPFLKNPDTIDNPFNLYHHPLETSAIFFGITHMPGDDEMNAEMEALWVKYRASGLNLAWWEQHPNEALSNQDD